MLAEVTNAGTSDAVRVWDVRNPRSPRLITTLQTTGTVSDIEMSGDGSRVAALVQPPPDSGSQAQTLDVWPVTRPGASHQLAALPVNGGMVYAEFVPRTHLILFGPTPC